MQIAVRQTIMKATGFSLEDEDASEVDQEDFMRGVIAKFGPMCFFCNLEGHFKSDCSQVFQILASFQSLRKRQQNNLFFRKRQKNNEKINVFSEPSNENLRDEKKSFSKVKRFLSINCNLPYSLTPEGGSRTKKYSGEEATTFAN